MRNISEALDHRDHGDDDDHQQVVKKEVVEEAEQCYQWLTPEKSPQSMEDNLIFTHFSNFNTTPLTPSPSTPSSSFQVKWLKSKEMKDKLSPIWKKKPSASKSKQVVPDLAGKFVSCKRQKAARNGLNSPGQVKSPTMIRAEEVQLSLGPEFPSFVKLLVRSHVAICFWMGLPPPFCKSLLPRKDGTVILEDESGKQFEVKYIAQRMGLSAGWKRFAVGHKLLERDVLVFHLVEPNKFKVYIIRANDLTEVNGARSNLNLDALARQNDADNEERASTALKIKKRKHPESVPFTVVQKKSKWTGLSRSVPQLGLPVEQSGNDSEEVGSEVLEGSKFSGSAIRFKDIKSFEDFHILVNGFCIDSELPEQARMTYYELCCSRNAYLHDRISPGLYCKLVVGIIGETVNIADAIRAIKFTTLRDEYAVWEKSLKSFELLGMNVGFLRIRLRRLLSLAFGSEVASDTKRYIEAKAKQTRSADEIRNLVAKLVELKEAYQKFDADIDTLKSKAESYELKFQEEVNAPW